MKILGISGFATCGKDLYARIAKNIFSKNGIRCVRLAYADALKKDLDEFLKNKYNISAWTKNPHEKIIIRPLLVAHGCGMRNISEGKYWVDLVNKNIEELKNDVDIFVIPDVRFDNEAIDIIKHGGTMVHIKKYRCEDSTNTVGKIYQQAPNEEELRNDPAVQKLADYNLEWEDMSTRKMTYDELVEDGELNDIVLRSLIKLELIPNKNEQILQSNH